MWEFLKGPVTGLVDSVGGIIDNLHTSNAEQMEARAKLLEIERSFHRELLQAESKMAEEQAKVITAEAQSESWLARNWRPILMLTFTYIIAHNYIFAPTLSLTILEIPGPMWELLKIGVGGYIVGRSAEKGIKEWKTPRVG